MRESQEELQKRLTDASAKVTIGARYMHYKQMSYKVLTLALLEETNEPCVVYQAEYGDHITFIRPVENWLETVEVDGKTVLRFKRLG